MRWVILVAVLMAQSDAMTGPWVGPLEMTVQSPTKVRGAIPTDVDLQQHGDQISGTWRSRPPNTSSGTIGGTITKPEIVFYADAETEAERCQARITFEARLTPANVYRLTSTKIEPDRRAKKACGPWPTDLVWLLQRAH